MVPQINSVGLKQRFPQLRHTSKRGSSKILWLKSGHCMLNRDKGKIDHETQPNCEAMKHQNITFSHCKKYEEEK